MKPNDATELLWITATKRQWRIVVTVFPRSRVVCTVINKSDLNIAWTNLCNSLHHIISISRRVLGKQQPLCLHFRYSSCRQRLVFGSISPGSRMSTWKMLEAAQQPSEISEGRPLCIVFTDFTSGRAERNDANRCTGASYSLALCSTNQNE